MFYVLLLLFSFSTGSVVKNLPAMQKPQETGEFDPWVGKISWRKKWQSTPVFLPGESLWTEELDGWQSMGSQRAEPDWSNWLVWYPFLSKGLSRVFSSITIQKHQFFGAWSNSHIHTWLLEKSQIWLRQNVVKFCCSKMMSENDVSSF